MRALILILLVASPVAADTADAVTDHIRPGYAAFAKAATALAAEESCDPAAVRPAFNAAFDAWLAVSYLHLGPAEQDGRALAILFWPDAKGLGAKAQTALLIGDPGALTPQKFPDQSVAARGLMALERLLYPAKALPSDPCPLIHATADDLARMGQEISIEWGPYGDNLLTAGQPGNTVYLTDTEATQALFTRLVTGIEFTADQRLGRPLGTFDRPRPDRAEATASARSLRNITLSLSTLRRLAVALHPDSPLTLAAFDRALGLAAKLDDPALQGVANSQGRLKVEILQQAVRAVHDAALAELGPALSVTLGLNAGDGD